MSCRRSLSPTEFPCTGLTARAMRIADRTIFEFYIASTPTVAQNRVTSLSLISPCGVGPVGLG